LPEPLGSDGKSNGDFVSLTGAGLLGFGFDSFSGGLAITFATLMWLYEPPGNDGNPEPDDDEADRDGKSATELVILGSGLDGGGWLLFDCFAIVFCV